MAKKLEALIFHCSATDQGNVSAFRRHHVETNGWRDVGYNAIVLNGHENNSYDPNRDGIIEEGRGIDLSNLIEADEVGAHALGYNSKSLGFCLVGTDRFTIKQFESAILICKLFKKIVPGLKILGHCETPRTTKTCPNFGMTEFRKAIDDESGSLMNAIMDNLKKWIKDD